MIAALSFCNGDRAMALELSRHIECLRGVEKHRIFIFHPSNVESADIAKLCAESFGEMRDIPYEERLKGWPDGPNQCFFEAANYISLIRGNDPWLWMEADCVPMRPRWMDAIEAEYYMVGRPILGAFENSWSKGEITGRHVTGVGVYPRDFIHQAPSLKTIVAATTQYRDYGTIPPAFDVYLSPYSVPLCGESQTMRHYWKSHRYHRTGNGVECAFRSPYGASPVVDMSAALIHGAKDFSLLDIVQSQLSAVSN